MMPNEYIKGKGEMPATGARYSALASQREWRYQMIKSDWQFIVERALSLLPSTVFMIFQNNNNNKKKKTQHQVLEGWKVADSFTFFRMTPGPAPNRIIRIWSMGGMDPVLTLGLAFLADRRLNTHCSEHKMGYTGESPGE